MPNTRNRVTNIRKNRAQKYAFLFLVSSAFAFLALVPRTSAADIRTVSGLGFVTTPTGWLAGSFPAGTDFPTSAITGAYFDVTSSVNAATNVYLQKESFTGSVYTDGGSWLTTANVLKDIYVPAVNVKRSASPYDYVEFMVSASAGKVLLIGVGVTK